MQDLKDYNFKTEEILNRFLAKSKMQYNLLKLLKLLHQVYTIHHIIFTAFLHTFLKASFTKFYCILYSDIQWPDVLEHSFSLIESLWSRKASFFWRSILKSNARIRTMDLCVMSPARFHCATLFLIIKFKKLKTDQNSKI